MTILLSEKLISSKTIYKGKLLNLKVDQVLLPNGKCANREVVVHHHCVAVAAINTDNKLVLIRQYRHPAKQILWEVPAGVVNKNETPFAAAKRELIEETGFVAKELKRVLSAFTTPGFTTELMHFFVARDLVFKKNNLDTDEFIEIKLVDLKKAWDMVLKGKIKDCKTIISILMTKFK